MADRARRLTRAVWVAGMCLAWLPWGMTAWAAEPPGTPGPGPRPQAAVPQGQAAPPKGLAQLGLAPGPDAESEEESLQVLVPLPRDLRRRLAEAEEALEQQRYAEAVTDLDSLLNGPDAEDYFIAGAEQEGTRTSLKATVRRLLGSMPTRGREAYELQFGADARRLLDGAIQAGDVDKLTDVSRRYFHTRAGADATLLAPHCLLSQGQALAAAILLQRFDETQHTADHLEPELSLLRAVCWRAAGDREAAEKSVVRAAQRFPNATVSVQGKEVAAWWTCRPVGRLPDRTSASAALAWLDGVMGTRPQARHRGTSQWLVHRGDGAVQRRQPWRCPPGARPAARPHGQRLE